MVCHWMSCDVTVAAAHACRCGQASPDKISVRDRSQSWSNMTCACGLSGAQMCQVTSARPMYNHRSTTCLCGFGQDHCVQLFCNLGNRGWWVNMKRKWKEEFTPAEPANTFWPRSWTTVTYNHFCPASLATPLRDPCKAASASSPFPCRKPSQLFARYTKKKSWFLSRFEDRNCPGLSGLETLITAHLNNMPLFPQLLLGGSFLSSSLFPFPEPTISLALSYTVALLFHLNVREV